jgi:uncharacterized SAM-binding protein YcdF (DUF218 family)
MIFAIILLLALILGVISFIFKEQILLAIGNYLVIQDELNPVDVIHVIAGEDNRTEYAIRLYQQGYGKTIFFTGGWCTHHKYYHGEHGMQLALEAGVPMEDIDFDDSKVTSTYSETIHLKAWMDQRSTPIRSVIVVSDPFHMRRARWTTRQVLGKDVEIIMAPVPFTRTSYLRQWWKDELSRKYVEQEYLKIVYYFVRYQLAFKPINDWLASFDQG